MSIFRLGCLLSTLLLSGSLAAQTIALISDLNGRYGSTVYNDRVSDAVDTVIRMQPDLVISTGDMVAGQKQPQLDRDRLDQMWQGFNLTVADPLSRSGIPFAVTPGNHDGSGFPEYALERERFRVQWESRTHSSFCRAAPGRVAMQRVWAEFCWWRSTERYQASCRSPSFNSSNGCYKRMALLRG